jgi:hypothetical protein
VGVLVAQGLNQTIFPQLARLPADLAGMEGVPPLRQGCVLEWHAQSSMASGAVSTPRSQRSSSPCLLNAQSVLWAASQIPFPDIAKTQKVLPEVRNEIAVPRFSSIASNVYGASRHG